MGRGAGGRRRRGPYFQSERLEYYARYAKQLLDDGKAYYCYCSRERLEDMRARQEAAKLPPGYDRRCRDLSPEEREKLLEQNPNPVIRFKMKLEGRTEFDDIVRGRVAFENSLQDDFVIIKADLFPTYHFASVVDDRLMEITHVVRGEEWLSSAPKHIQLYEALGWDPPVWVHPPLILDITGKRLSKRSGTHTSFAYYREAGYLPDAMLNFLATMGWSSGEDKKIFTRPELIEKFSFEGIVNHPAIFDIDKLNDLNGEYIRMLSAEDFAEMALPWLQKAGWVSESPSEDDLAYMREVTGLIHDRIVLLSEIPDVTSYFYNDDFEYEEKGVKKHLAKDTTPALLKSVIEGLAGLAGWTRESVESAVREAGASRELDGGKVIHPVRMAVTGRTYGPGLFDLMQVIGRERCIARLERAGAANFEF